MDGRKGWQAAPFGDGIPDGIPVGRALMLPPRILCEDLYEAVRSLSQVHGDGALAPVPVVLRPRLPAFATFIARDGHPSQIVLRSDGPHCGFTFLHEVGHLLDYASIDTPGRYASSSDAPILGAWREAATASQAVQRLRRIVATAVASLPPEGHRRRAVLQDSLSLEELWARSYAQYVAVQSGSQQLGAALDAFRTRAPGSVYYPLQWDDDDFRSIGFAIDDVLRSKGWRSDRPS